MGQSGERTIGTTGVHVDGLTALIRGLLRTPHTESDVQALVGVTHAFPPPLRGPRKARLGTLWSDCTLKDLLSLRLLSLYMAS